MTNNLVSNIHLGTSAGTVPTVGMGATVCHYSDRSAVTVVAIRYKKDGSIKEIDTRADKTTRTDSNGMSDAQSYTYEPGDDTWPVATWRVDAKGRYRRMFHDYDGAYRMADPKSGSKLALGIRDEFYDYSF
jgi:hypothetical protein